MFGSVVAYLGLILTVAGMALLVRPIPRLRVPTRTRALAVAISGALLVAAGLSFPVRETRVSRASTWLDEFAPVWQFGEFHTITIAATPARVFEAIERVRADEILLFRTLTWIRRGGRPLPGSILDAGEDAPLIDVATQSDFVRLAHHPPRELVIGTVIMAPHGTSGTPTPQLFRTALPAGFTLATMNFFVTPNGEGGSIVSTETRVYANSPDGRRRFAAYWRMIYPGSAIIRRMWLRAIQRRATRPEEVTDAVICLPLRLDPGGERPTFGG